MSKGFVDSIKILRWDFAFDCADFLILVLIWLNFLYIASIACSEVMQIALLYQDVWVALICQFWSFTTAVQNLQLTNSSNVAYWPTQTQGMVGKVESLLWVLTHLWIFEYCDEIIVKYLLCSGRPFQISDNLHAPGLITGEIPELPLAFATFG